MDADTVKKMKVNELRDALQQLSLPTTGRKEDLIQRLLAALPPPSATTTANTAPTPQLPPVQTHSLLALDPMSLERLRARRERFGVETSSKLKEAEEAEARERRAARFG